MKTTLRSQDLTCPSCVAKIETALRRMDGVTDANVRFNSGRIVVEHDEKVDVDTIRAAIRNLGYETRDASL